ncbi:MAG: pyridoxamine 5'-phosphate oxidase family protein, partial [Subdoligranulum variabile]|nr:pyridoxamine 5'-phosphate oxidase family protein [Subdoligranulum variabile]
GHKLECLKENRNVFVEIDRGESLITADIPCEYGAEYESVMCRGKAMIIEDIKEKCKALAVLMKVQTGEEHEIDDKMASAVNVVKIDVESYTAKACIR